MDRVEKLLSLRDQETAYLVLANADLDQRLLHTDFGGVHRDKRTPIFESYPVSLQVSLKAAYLETAGPTCRILLGEPRQRAIEAGQGTDSYYQADIELVAKDRSFRKSFAHIAFNESEIRERAASHAGACYRISRANAPERALHLACEYARKAGIQPPEPRKREFTSDGCLNRLKSDRWWRRKLRNTYTRKAEETLRADGFVHAGAALYVSTEALRSTVDRYAANFRLLAGALATNDLRQSFSLSELSARSTSNPIIRRAELMVHVRGCERYATEQGHVAALFVLTLPSRFHCCHRDGRRVWKFDGATPRDGQRWLNQHWQCMRSTLHRKGVPFYGLRTVEPHHDGTPHWNVLAFAESANLEAIAAEFERRFLLSDSPDEQGARAHRIKRTDIDPTKGDATSYMAKYISKNVDGLGVGADHEDGERQRDATETCARAEVWARVHGIRQFQFFGGPAGTVWRELRRLHRPSIGIIEEVRQAAESTDWCSFIRHMGGVRRSAHARPVRLHKIIESAALGLYGDPLGSRVVGVESDDLVEVTRIREWTVDWQAGRSATGVVANRFLPWSPVNNCTPANLSGLA